MAEGDHPWRCGWSGRTMYGAVDGPAGPYTLPWMVPRTMYGAVDGPAGPTVGGTIYGMTVPGYTDTQRRRNGLGMSGRLG